MKLWISACAIAARMTNSRAFHSGHQFCFDILMDVGGFRDMHRHRRCTQIEQGFTRLHGYDTPPDITAAGLEPRYQQAMERVAAASAEIGESSEAALYLLPMAYRKRTLFKMDFAEALYIAELRSGAGWTLFLSKRGLCHVSSGGCQAPGAGKYFRVTDVTRPLTLFKR